MRLSIAGIFQEANYRFDFSQNYLALLSQEVKNNLLPCLAGEPFQDLEIYICTNSQSQNHLEKISNKNAIYLSFNFWFDYRQVVQNVTDDFSVLLRLDIFTSIFFDLLQKALPVLDKNIIEKTKNNILFELQTAPEKYIFQISDIEKSLRKKLAALRADTK